MFFFIKMYVTWIRNIILILFNMYKNDVSESNHPDTVGRATDSSPPDKTEELELIDSLQIQLSHEKNQKQQLQEKVTKLEALLESAKPSETVEAASPCNIATCKYAKILEEFLKVYMDRHHDLLQQMITSIETAKSEEKDGKVNGKAIGASASLTDKLTPRTIDLRLPNGNSSEQQHLKVRNSDDEPTEKSITTSRTIDLCLDWLNFKSSNSNEISSYLNNGHASDTSRKRSSEADYDDVVKVPKLFWSRQPNEISLFKGKNHLF